MSNVCKYQCPIFSGVCNPNECEIFKESNRKLQVAFNELLDEAIDLYSYYPNNHRAMPEGYFKKYIELRNKLSCTKGDNQND